MQFIPNRTKICKRCNKVILYNEEYNCIDRLDSQGGISTDTTHTNCWQDEEISRSQYQQYAQRYAQQQKTHMTYPMPASSPNWKAVPNTSTYAPPSPWNSYSSGVPAVARIVGAYLPDLYTDIPTKTPSKRKKWSKIFYDAVTGGPNGKEEKESDCAP